MIGVLECAGALHADARASTRCKALRSDGEDGDDDRAFDWHRRHAGRYKSLRGVLVPNDQLFPIFGRHEKIGLPYMNTLKLLGLEEFSEWAQLD